MATVAAQGINSFKFFMAYKGSFMVEDDALLRGMERCAALVREAGGEVVGSVQLYDRLEALVDLGVPNVALIEYAAPENFAAATCPLCRDGIPVTRF